MNESLEDKEFLFYTDYEQYIIKLEDKLFELYERIEFENSIGDF
mgnify:CR=1 FL=1